MIRKVINQKLILSVFVFASIMFAMVMYTLPLTAYANPIKTTDLSGTWKFTPMGEKKATKIKVPGGGWYKQGFTKVDEADYERSITIPDSGQPQVTKIEFGAVNYEASLYINKKLVGTQITAFTPSVFDITKYVKPGKKYTLKVHVKGKNASSLKKYGRSLVPNAAGWSTNIAQGIYRSAKIVVYPENYISDVFVKPSVEKSELNYDVWVTNASKVEKTFTISGELSSWNGNSFNYPGIDDKSITVKAGETSKVTVGPIKWDLGTTSYWWPNVPYKSGYTAQLHNLKLTLKESGVAKDTNTTRFGFKEVVQKSDGTSTNYYLNGIRVNFRGDSLQGVNYDAINYGGGVGDAFDTFPGFLPGNNGWPAAVDNYERLNYNFVRIHQEPATPYMLDVCDEKGLMIMEETAIRGSNNDQDFLAGHDNMVNHLKALFSRDRNHASIVRYSISNEPELAKYDSDQFEIDLYNAAMAVDGTRPLSIDAKAKTYEALKYNNFSVIMHYSTDFACYSDEVNARPDRPYGQGEYVWYTDNTKQGFAWFATTTQAMRSKNASDIRPYTLLSAWASLIPGAKNDFVLEQKGNSLYGANNLSDPWSNSQFKRVQAAFNPVLVADRDYWDANKLSNENGEWPSQAVLLPANTNVTRTLNIFNDTFDTDSGSKVDVYWEVRSDSSTGTLLASGELHPTVTQGYMVNQDISFKTPATSGKIYLVLYSKKSGVEMFRETSTVFNVTTDPIPISINDSVTGTGNNQFEFSGFSAGKDGRCYKSDNHYATKKESYCIVRFSGTNIKWFASKDRSFGIMAVSIDGGAEKLVDCYSKTRLDQVLLFDSGTLTDGQHTLKVRLTPDKNKDANNHYIYADRVEITPSSSAPTESGTNKIATAWTPVDGALQINQLAENNNEYKVNVNRDYVSLFKGSSWTNYFMQGFINFANIYNRG